jgi:hypothetical protein
MANADSRKDEASQLAPNQVKLPCQDAPITETEPRIVARTCHHSHRRNHIYTFSQIRKVAKNKQTTQPVCLLSRYDKSATTIKDSLLFQFRLSRLLFFSISIRSPSAAPILSLDAKLRNQTVIYKAGSNTADDPLLNPARLLVGK